MKNVNFQIHSRNKAWLESLRPDGYSKLPERLKITSQIETPNAMPWIEIQLWVEFSNLKDLK